MKGVISSRRRILIKKKKREGYIMGRRLDYNDYKFDVFGMDNGFV